MHRFLKVAVAAGLGVLPAAAQFSSGSSGSDGALTIPDNAGIVIFDPVALGIDTDGDNIFHFTTISIGNNSTLKLKASKMRKNAAVVFLASGSITFGTSAALDLTGEAGVNVSSPVQVSRRPADPGPGGYPGGLGNRTDTTPPTPASDGYGPAGSRGVAATSGCNPTPGNANAGTAHMTIAMIPLVGGAGGAGGYCDTSGATGGNGGAGGGAIRIVSSTQINFGTFSYIDARGGFSSGNAVGTGYAAGTGGGGMIHLIAPSIVFAASNQLYAFNPSIGSSVPATNGSGVIRINTSNLTGVPNSTPTHITGALYNLPLPAGIPEVTITQVNGTSVANPPSGLTSAADVVINTASAATVTIATKNVPVGTVINLRINSETVVDQALNCNAVAGTLASGSATCSATFPLGANVTVASASW